MYQNYVYRITFKNSLKHCKREYTDILGIEENLKIFDPETQLQS